MATITDMLAAMSEGEVRYLNDTTTQPDGINDSAIVWPRTRTQFDADAAFTDDTNVSNNMQADNAGKITDFNGGVWDSRREKLIIQGGGHVSTGDNSTKEFDPTTGLWDDPLTNGPSRYKQSAAGADPSAPFGPATADRWPYPNASGELGPVTVHSYGGLFYKQGATAADDRMLMFGANTWHDTPANVAPGGIWARKLDTGVDVWEGLIAVSGGNASNQSMEYDAGTDTLYIIGGSNFGRRITLGDSTVNTLSTTNMGWVGSIPGAPAVTAPDPSRVGNPLCHLRRSTNTAWIRWPRIFADTGTATTKSETVSVTGTDPSLRGHSISGAPGTILLSDNTTALLWYGKEYLYPFDTQAMKWLAPVQFTGFSGGTVPSAGTHSGIWGKFQFLPTYGAALGCNGTNGDVFLFKLPTTFPADPSASGSVAARRLSVSIGIGV